MAEHHTREEIFQQLNRLSCVLVNIPGLIKLVSEFFPPSRVLRPFYLHQWIDVCDTVHQWIAAQVIQVGVNTIRIHYHGWKIQYDEELHSSENHPDTERIALLYAHSFKPRNPPCMDFRLGKLIEASDTQDNWLMALIIDEDLLHNMVKIKYLGWSSKFDEWINVESPRLSSCLYTHIPRKMPWHQIARNTFSLLRLCTPLDYRIRSIIVSLSIESIYLCHCGF